MADVSEASSIHGPFSSVKHKVSAESFTFTGNSVISEPSSLSPRPKDHPKYRADQAYPSAAQNSDSDDDILGGYDNGQSTLGHDRLVDNRIQRRASMLVDAVGERLIIAIDFGTTFTGVAYVLTSLHEANLEDIRIIRNWGEHMDNDPKVPTKISYSPSIKGERQWGKDFSENAVTMINVKLELDIHGEKTDQLDLILQLLDGTENLGFEYIQRSKDGRPEYSSKSPESIITDYMENIFKTVIGQMSRFDTHGSPLDVSIVMTVPVDWSYKAKNSTFRAIRAGGFNQEKLPGLRGLFMVTEPEAAAIYTARHLKGIRTQNFLEVNECFVLVDAGGGTVDVVSYMVQQLEPSLELTKIGNSASKKCGSTFIDSNFKLWLLDLIGEKHYRRLDPQCRGRKLSRSSETSQMRAIMSQFQEWKHTFSADSTTRAMSIELRVKALDGLSIAGKLDRGLLTISKETMIEFFDPCVNDILQLVITQRNEIGKMQNRRLRKIFLVGGFGSSKFLRQELELSLRGPGIQVQQPDTSWTAVVQGALIHGIERTSNIMTTSTCPRNYGIALNEYNAAMFNPNDLTQDSYTGLTVAQSQMSWLIKKGDLILSDESSAVEKTITFDFYDDDGDRRFKLPIYAYDNDDLPERLQGAEAELTIIKELDCDLSRIPVQSFSNAQLHSSVSGRTSCTVYLTCRMLLAGEELEVSVLVDGKPLISDSINLLVSSGDPWI